jgi:hypothetical protein
MQPVAVDAHTYTRFATRDNRKATGSSQLDTSRCTLAAAAGCIAATYSTQRHGCR